MLLLLPETTSQSLQVVTQTLSECGWYGENSRYVQLYQLRSWDDLGSIEQPPVNNRNLHLKAI